MIKGHPLPWLGLDDKGQVRLAGVSKRSGLQAQVQPCPILIASASSVDLEIKILAGTQPNPMLDSRLLRG